MDIPYHSMQPWEASLLFTVDPTERALNRSNSSEHALNGFSTSHGSTFYSSSDIVQEPLPLEGFGAQIPQSDFHSAAFNAIPKRYHGLGLSPLDTYFAMARGRQADGVDVPAGEMKKW